MNKRTKWACGIICVLIVLTIAFIFANSLDSRDESTDKSQFVMQIVEPILELFVGRGNVTEHLVRKLAHFSEFGLLGVELSLLMVVRGRVRAQGTVNCLFAGLCVAVSDETIQIFSNRGSQVQDVLLDFAGAATGILGVLLIYAIVRLIVRKRA